MPSWSRSSQKSWHAGMGVEEDQQISMRLSRSRWTRNASSAKELWLPRSSRCRPRTRARSRARSVALWARVNAHNRVRTITTVSGELRLSRNYHYCTDCKHGFCPRDAELKLPEEGVVSDAMERRILDFGVNSECGSPSWTAAAGAERANCVACGR